MNGPEWEDKNNNHRTFIHASGRRSWLVIFMCLKDRKIFLLHICMMERDERGSRKRQLMKKRGNQRKKMKINDSSRFYKLSTRTLSSHSIKRNHIYFNLTLIITTTQLILWDDSIEWHTFKDLIEHLQEEWLPTFLCTWNEIGIKLSPILIDELNS